MIGCLVAAVCAIISPQALLARDAPQTTRGLVAIVSGTERVLSLDERPITYYVDRPDADGQFPILLVVDGSGCLGQRRPVLAQLYFPSAEAPKPYARVMVEKPGVESTANTLGVACTSDFLKNYTMDNRVFDHMRVLQHLRAHADWWNGELYVWGWSDGGDIAAQLVVYYPEIARAVIGAAGGGFTMAELFEDFWVCPSDMGEGRDARLSGIRAQFAEMEDNPTWQKTWGGEDNSWRTWASRMRTRLSKPLADNQTPILLVHGALDMDSIPVDSARKLASDLEAEGNTAFTYWEVPEMKHGWGSLPDHREAALLQGMLSWLLTGAVDPAELVLIKDHGTDHPTTSDR